MRARRGTRNAARPNTVSTKRREDQNCLNGVRLTLTFSSVNLHARLEAAMAAARRGDHERALREYRWFHEHALDHDPSYCGVRLSFALAAWVDLAEAYPPARAALIQIRDAKARRLLRGEGDRATFEDVEAINGHLGDPRATYDLFRRLREVQPGAADACADLAWETAATFDDFALARTCVDDPSARLRAWTDELNETVSFIRAQVPRPPAELEAAACAMFAERVVSLLRVLANVGETAEAAALRAGILGAVADPSVRNLVRSHLGSAA